MNKSTIRLLFSFSALGASLVPAFLMEATLPGCLGASSPAPAGTTSSSSSSSGGSTDGAGADAPASGDCTMLPILPSNSLCIVDDMTMAGNFTGGYWYTYSDRTLPNTTTLVDGQATIPVSCTTGQPGASCVIATADGTLNPVEGAQFPPDPDLTTGPMVGGAIQAFRRFSGMGLTLWGAGMGFDWKDTVQADASVSDAADAAPALGSPTSFDAGDHKGIAFWAKSNTGAPQNVGIHFSDVREAVAGGECDASVYFNSPVECGDDYFKTIPVTANWAQYHVLFADPLVHTQNYTLMGLHAGGLDTHHLFQTHFQINNTSFVGMGAVAPGPAFDISVAYVTFYDGV